MKKTLKRVLSLFLSILIAIPMIMFTPLSAELGTKADAAYSATNLRFNADGEFKILQLADIQDSYLCNQTNGGAGSFGIDWRAKRLITLAIREAKPDLIVLTGDNIVGIADNELGNPTAYYDRTAKELEDLFVDTEGNAIPWTFTFGNHEWHDNQINGVKISTKDQYDALLGSYEPGTVRRSYGEIIDYDSTQAITGQTDVKGTGRFSVYSQDGSSRLWDIEMINSGTNQGGGYGRAGGDVTGTENTAQYNAVVNWVNSRPNKDTIPSVTFQHIALQEFVTCGDIVEQTASGGYSSYPNATGITGNYKLKDGVKGEYNEQCCYSYYSTEAMYNALADSNCKGVFWGHDHTNTAEGVGTIGNRSLFMAYAPGVGYVQYDGGSNAGARVITLKTNKTLETKILKNADLVNKYVTDVDTSRKLYYGNAKFVSGAGSYSATGETGTEPFAFTSFSESYGYSPSYSKLLDKGFIPLTKVLNDPTRNVDLNEPKSGNDHKGAVIYMGYKTTNNPNEAIVSLRTTFHQKDNWNNSVRDAQTYTFTTAGAYNDTGVVYHAMPLAWYYAENAVQSRLGSKQDLAEGTGSKYFIGLWYATAQDFINAGKTAPMPITEIALAMSDSYTGYNIVIDDEGGLSDFNKGYDKGEYLRMFFRTGMESGIEDITDEYNELVANIENFASIVTNASSYETPGYNAFKTEYDKLSVLKNNIDGLTGYNTLYGSKEIDNAINSVKEKVALLEYKAFAVGPGQADGVYFNVPETIYLAPNGSAFQYAANQTLNKNGTITNNGPAVAIGSSTNNVQFYYPNTKSVTISASGGGVSALTLGGSSRTSITLSSGSNFTNVQSTSMTGGTGTAKTSGYIVWTATYVDGLTNETKTVKAYTYVYGVNADTSAVGSMCYVTKVQGERNANSVQNAWITGVHSIATETISDQRGETYASTKGTKTANMPQNPLITPISTLGYDGSDTPADYNSITANSSGNTFISAKKSSKQVSANMISYSYSNRVGTINIDSSRYNSLNKYTDIPNFNFGTDVRSVRSASSKSDAQFRGGYTLGTSFDTQTESGVDVARRYMNYTYRGDGQTGRYSATNVKNSSGFTNPSIYTTNTKLSVVSFIETISLRTGSGWDRLYNTCFVYCNLNYNNKDALRNKVLQIQGEFANLGVYGNGETFSSYYFVETDTRWTAFRDAYIQAYKDLTRVDANITNNGSALQTAYDNLMQSCPRKWSSTAVTFNVAKDHSTGKTRAIPNATPTNSTQYSSGQSIRLSAAEELQGYTFVGFNRIADGATNAIGLTPSTVNPYLLKLASTQNVRFYALYEPKAYTVTLNAQQSTGYVVGSHTDGTTSVTAYMDEALPTITVPTRTAYTFGGYYESPNGNGVKYYDENGVSVRNWNHAGTGTLYAHWVPKEYVATFNNANNFNEQNQPVPYITRYTIETSNNIRNASKTGYELVQWTVTAQNGNWTVGSTFTPNDNYLGKYGDVTFNGNWTAKKYTVGINNGTDSTKLFSNLFSVDSMPDTKTISTANGNSLTVTKVDNNTIKLNGTIYGGASIIRVPFAVQTGEQYKFSMNRVSGSNSNGSGCMVLEFYTAGGSSLNAEQGGRKHLDFNSNTGESTKVLDINDTNCELIKCIELRVWHNSAQPVMTYNDYVVSIKVEKVGELSDTYSFAKEFTFDQIAPSFPLFTVPVKTGYTFEGYFDGLNKQGTKYYNADGSATGSLWTRDEYDKVIYGGWTANQYTVKYNGNGNTGGSTASSSHTYDAAKNLTANGFTKTGYTFAGWSDVNGNNYTNSQSVINLTSVNNATINLNAKWNAITYTVVYNGNGSTSGSTASSSHTYDANKALTNNGFSKTGYTFAGWNTKADGTGTLYSNAASVKNLASTQGATVNLYAQWSKNTYTVVYNGNGSTSGSTTPSTHTYDVNKVLTNNGFERTGFVFAGWSTNANGTGTLYSNGASVKNLASTQGATVILYARWINIATELTSAVDIGLECKIVEPAPVVKGSVTTSYKYMGVANSAKSGYTTDTTASSSANGNYGTLTYVDGILKYQRNTMVFTRGTSEVFYILTKVTTVGASTKTDYVYQKLTIGTADSIYFEDSFVTSPADSISGSWIKDGTISNENHEMVYDYDKGTYVSKVNNESFEYSQGQTTKATVGLSNESAINFNFTGTGFEIIGNTTQESGTFILTITKDGETKGKNYTVDTYNGFRYCYLSYGRYNATQGIFGYEVGVESKFNPNTDSKYKALYYYTPSEDERKMSTDTLRANGIIRTGTSDSNAGDGTVNKYYTFDSNKAGANPTLAKGWAAYDGNSVNDTNSYQTPLITIMGLDWGKYNVNIRAVYSPFYDHNARTDSTKQYDVYFDGVNIFDPMEPSFNKRIVLKSLLKGSEQVSTVESTGVLVSDSGNNTLNTKRLSDMFRYSTNSEFILNGTLSNEANSICFKIPENNGFDDVMLGMRTNVSEGTDVTIIAEKNGVTKSAVINVDSAKQKFYSFIDALSKENDECTFDFLIGATFTVKNSSENGIVSISMLKYNAHILTQTSTESSTGEPVVSNAIFASSLRMLKTLDVEPITPEEIITPPEEVITPDDKTEVENEKCLFKAIIKLLEIIRIVLKSFGINV